MEKKNDNYGSKSVFVFEPKVNLMLNDNKGLRVGIGASYRIMTGSKVSNKEFNGPSIDLIFNFGKSMI